MKNSFLFIHEKLRHLSDNQIHELMKRYYDNEKIGNLIRDYNLDIISRSSLYTLFPPLVIEDKKCPNCNTTLVQDRPSRTGISNKYGYCSICKHIESKNCICPYCSKKREEERLKNAEQEKLERIRKRELIYSQYSRGRFKPVNVENISFSDKVYLGALLRLCLSEDFTIINSLDSINRELAPTNKMKWEMVTSLFSKNIIIVHPDSPIKSFTGSEESPFPGAFYINSVNYYLNVHFPNDEQNGIKQLINPEDFDRANSEEAFHIWREIALAECLEFLDYQMNKVNFDFNPGKKTISVFNDLLNNFSVSQTYGVIYKSISNAARFYQEKTVPKKQAANSVIGSCQRYAEQAVTNKWDLTKFKRNYDLPQTMTSEFFFYRVLKIGNLGFDMPPTKL